MYRRTENILSACVPAGAKAGIYAVSLSDKQVLPLRPGMETFTARFSKNGKSVYYAVDEKREILIYSVAWSDGKLTGEPKVAVRLPFSFQLNFRGNAYDICRDLSTVVYGRSENCEKIGVELIEKSARSAT